MITINSMLATLLIVSLRLPKAGSLTAASQAEKDIASHEQVLQELHAATKAFESLDASRQSELLQCTRIAQLITSLQWQLVHVLHLYLTCSTAPEMDIEVKPQGLCNL